MQQSLQSAFTGDRARDEAQLQSTLAELRREVLQRPIDPYQVLPSGRYKGDFEQKVAHRLTQVSGSAAR